MDKEKDELKRLTAFILLITILTLTGPGAQVRVWAEEKLRLRLPGREKKRQFQVRN